jgi:Tfp pilus assembly protein PilF
MKRTTALLVAFAIAVCGCEGMGGSKAGSERQRNPSAARRHNENAVEYLKKDQFDKAEKELKAAIAADDRLDAAHNNLGAVYLRQKRYYAAAQEFDQVAKLLPNRAEPRNNLGMVYEAAGKLDDAAEWYDKAYALDPNSTDIIGNLARVLVRIGRRDEKTRRLLTEVVMRDPRPEWIAWAKERLAAMGPLEKDSPFAGSKRGAEKPPEQPEAPVQ